ncbi:MAG: hypothetical protein QM785_11220 [Pyrinomonadaceae bacterium]
MKKLWNVAVPAIVCICGSIATAQAQPGKPPQPPPNQPVVVQLPVAASIPCPQIQIQGPNRTLKDGEPLTFAANIGGGDPNVQPMLSWSVSSGAITSGQGSRNITVDSTGAGNDRQIVADLLVGGYSYECNSRATVTVPIAAPAKKVDEFGDLPEKDEAGKLDSIVNYLGQAPDRVYIIGYAGRNNVRGYAADVLKRMKAYIAKAGTGVERVGAIDGGFREQPGYEIWVVPIGADSPRPTPTVDRKDIVYPKPPPPVKKPATKP